MKDNKIQAKDMVRYAIEYFTVGAKAWWEAYRKAKGLPEDIAWEKFKKMLLDSILLLLREGHKEKHVSCVGRTEIT